MIRALLERGFDVMVDGTHSTEISIKRILEIDINATAIPIFVDCSECIKRAKDTNQEDLIPVIERIHDNLRMLDFYDNLEGRLEYIKQEVIDRNLYGKFGETNG
jgi:hypothetical protein